MMKEDYGLSSDQDSIKRECADTITEFGHQFQVMQSLYRELGLPYPIECRTNYRDSWFHYRKLYNQKDDISILNEKYGLEEHLLRAIKDAQINFLQQVGQWLEVWYQYAEMSEDSADEVEYKPFDELGANWVNGVWKASGGNEEKFSRDCIHYYKNHIYSVERNNQLQNLVHSLKNLVLDLRLGGVNIFRPTDHVKYVRQTIAIYVEIGNALKESRMLYLLPATALIWKTHKLKKEKCL